MSFLGLDRRRRTAPFRLTALAWELHDLLDIPRTNRVSSGGFYYQEPTQGRRIIKAVLDCVARALRNGEDVTIDGVGTFRLVRRPRRLFYPIQPNRKQSTVLEECGGDAVVRFDPEPSLLTTEE